MTRTLAKTLLALVFCFSHGAIAQIVTDPLANGLEKGRTYFKWVVDINHDGIEDVLLGGKLTDEEMKDYPFPDLQGFGIYLGQKDGKYFNVQ